MRFSYSSCGFFKLKDQAIKICSIAKFYFYVLNIYQNQGKTGERKMGTEERGKEFNQQALNSAVHC